MCNVLGGSTVFHSIFLISFSGGNDWLLVTTLVQNDFGAKSDKLLFLREKSLSVLVAVAHDLHVEENGVKT